MAEHHTLKEILDLSAGHFAKHGLSSPRLEAELLIGHTLGLERIQLYVQFDRPLEENELEQMRQFIRRRLQGEPLAYILGEKEFMSLPFYVDSRVLIPRPETEHLVEKALELFGDREEVTLVDLGAGSGAIAVSLAYYLPQSRILALDINPESLELARKNALRNGVEDRIRFILGDLLDPIKDEEPVHGILSNPPYIPSGELAGLSPEVKAQPRLALDGGSDGLSYYYRIAKEAFPLLKGGGYLGLEVGSGQDDKVSRILWERGFKGVEIEKDYSGHKRCIWARKD